MRFYIKSKAFLFKLENKIAKTYFQYFNRHPSSAPYLSGDTFRTLAKQHYEKGIEITFSASAVSSNGIIFCESSKLKDFLDGDVRKLQVPFILISTNGDVNIGDEWIARLPDNLIVWFAQNVTVRHPKIRPLPIGLENKALYWHGVTSDFDSLRSRLSPKKSRILYGFTVGTNAAERGPALQVLSKLSTADAMTRVNSREYRRILAGYKFVASPPGNGLDCHRTWEALYLGVIPIVRRSVAMEEFEKLVPMWIVDDYRELEGVTEDELSRHYERLWNSSWNKDALWFEYWRNEIMAAAR